MQDRQWDCTGWAEDIGETIHDSVSRPGPEQWLVYRLFSDTAPSNVTAEKGGELQNVWSDGRR